MELKTEAVVLQAIDYKDDDKLLTLFSPTLGKITANIRGVKKPKAKLAFAAQPLCFCEYVLAQKNGRNTVTSAYLHESFFALREDITRFFAACIAAEMVKELATENDAHESLFIAFVECLKGLCFDSADEAETLVTFAIVALREAGYPIDLGFLEENDGDIGDILFFDFADGRFDLASRVTQGQRASVCTYHLLRKCAGLDYDETALAGGKKRALRLMKAYAEEKMQLSLPNFGEFLRMIEE